MKKHGESEWRIGGATTEYRSWYAAKTRCFNPRQPTYKYYGGRGITMCQRWVDSYVAFLEDMGRKPDRGCSLGRINNDGNYEPTNCRWETKKQQANNQSNNFLITHLGVTKTVHQWSEALGFRCETIRKRILRGWPPAFALDANCKQYP